MQTLKHPYRPKPWTMALASAFFGAIAFFMGREAMLNDRGLVINRLIHLGPDGATLFYWCIAATGAAFVAVGVPAFIMGLVSSHHVTVTATEISAPRFGFSRAATVVKLADVRHVTLQAVQKQRFLNVIHANGKLTITESFLPNRAAFEELCSAIASRVPVRPQG
ncbi:hypothetical protein [Ramlibacter tataouinensis]|uniref:Uncharacterized protein n=1 Tax=Ramlibacter tataouinensis (strain ATCC BAA-407 / DSM 14655 / LMG 21543 / TTB310) TaxID=365046 RepID=F5Y3L9_RAMTT|nr:hypothetical protein [Ramlibacter tataouinensis]AEG92493.1 hypothetical protein Rta_14060 [Ramlibacter tataouinensis TTB310]